MKHQNKFSQNTCPVWQAIKVTLAYIAISIGVLGIAYVVVAQAAEHSPHRRCAAQHAAKWNNSDPRARAWRLNELAVRESLMERGHPKYTIGKGEYIAANCLR